MDNENVIPPNREGDLDKELAINLIKGRILSEYRKHQTLDWTEIAARKIYTSIKEGYIKI
jgi:hypothetical protein